MQADAGVIGGCRLRLSEGLDRHAIQVDLLDRSPVVGLQGAYRFADAGADFFFDGRLIAFFPVGSPSVYGVRVGGLLQ